MPTFTVPTSPAAQVSVNVFMPEAIPGFEKVTAIAPQVSGLKRGFVLSNGDVRQVVGVAVKWTVVDGTGSQQVLPFKSHSYLAPGFAPLVGFHQRLIVLPGMFIQEPLLRSQGMILSFPSKRLIDKFSTAQNVSAEIDSIIFSDGEIVGPNSLHLDSDIQGRRDAVDIVIRTVHAGAMVSMRRGAPGAATPHSATEIDDFIHRLDGHLPDEHPIIQALKQLRHPAAADLASKAASEFSQQLIQTDHFKGMLDYIYSVPTPPTFYRKDGKPL